MGFWNKLFPQSESDYRKSQADELIREIINNIDLVTKISYTGNTISFYYNGHQFSCYHGEYISAFYVDQIEIDIYRSTARDLHKALGREYIGSRLTKLEKAVRGK